jgi:ElaB/YqjD/DUF883 family membrane-anchored ribosome-binding protein
MAATNQDYEGARSSSNGGPARDVKDDIDSLRSDLASLANSVSNLAGDKLGAAVNDAQAIAGEKLSYVESAIRRNPTQSALIAVGVGFLFGIILTR